MKSLTGNWGSDLQVRHKPLLLCTALAAEEFVFLFPSRHGFSHTSSSALSIRLQPLRAAFAVLFRRPGLQSRRKAPGSDGLQPLKKCLSLYSCRHFSHAVTLDEGPQ